MIISSGERERKREGGGEGKIIILVVPVCLLSVCLSVHSHYLNIDDSGTSCNSLSLPERLINDERKVS